MPKFEVNQYGDDQELLFKPAPGDLRIRDFATLERYDLNGTWVYIGDLEALFNNVLNLQTNTLEITNWMFKEQEKERVQIIADKLEEEFDDLREAGQYLRELEKMLRVARKTYDSMTESTKEKVKTFERLDTPYPDENNETGYQI